MPDALPVSPAESTRRRYLLRALSVMVIPLFLPLVARGQGAIDPARTYWGDLDAFFERQSEVALELAGDVLMRFPPRLPEPDLRPLAFSLLDAVLHEPEAPSRQAVQAFFHSFVMAAADEMESTRPGRGAIVWKIYNHGFVVRTRSVTLAFDLVDGRSAGAEGFALPAELMRRIVQECDVLFISHVHGDHADPGVAGLFLEQGKPVVGPPAAPSDTLGTAGFAEAAGVPGADSLQGAGGLQETSRYITLERRAHQFQNLPVRDGAVILEVVVYPGHQGDLENNVILVRTPEGVSVCHTGDQARTEDFLWIDEIAGQAEVDILLPNCWTPELQRLLQGMDPTVVITGHENELGHSVDHREPFWLTYDRMYGSAWPLVLMSWGESFHFIPDR